MTRTMPRTVQQLSLFHAYHDEYCYMPVHLYEGGTGKLITAILRPGRRIRGREAAGHHFDADRTGGFLSNWRRHADVSEGAGPLSAR